VAAARDGARLHQVRQTDVSTTQRAQTFEAFHETVAGAQSLQPPRSAQPIPLRDVTSLDRLGRFSSYAMESTANVRSGWYGPLDRLDVRLMVVGDDRTGYLARTAQRLLEERFSGGGVAVLPQQHVHHLTALVDGTVQVPLVVATEEEHLVGVPAPTERSALLAGFSGQLRPERLHPAQNSAIRDTSMPRSASSSITLVADSGWRTYQRTAIRITSAGHR
jgi:hypothetical protein